MIIIDIYIISMSVDMKEVKMKEREIAKICKALGDENRVKIIQLLTKGELCACKLLEEFNIGQSTLSHHMKILTDCDLVSFRKDGKWVYYSINCKKFSEFKSVIGSISCNKESGKAFYKGFNRLCVECRENHNKQKSDFNGDT